MASCGEILSHLHILGEKVYESAFIYKLYHSLGKSSLCWMALQNKTKQKQKKIATRFAFGIPQLLLSPFEVTKL